MGSAVFVASEYFDLFRSAMQPRRPEDTLVVATTHAVNRALRMTGLEQTVTVCPASVSALDRSGFRAALPRQYLPHEEESSHVRHRLEADSHA